VLLEEGVDLHQINVSKEICRSQEFPFVTRWYAVFTLKDVGHAVGNGVGPVSRDRPLPAKGLNRSRGSRFGHAGMVRCVSDSAMLTSEAIRLVFRQEQHHEPIVSSRDAVASTHQCRCHHR